LSVLLYAQRSAHRALDISEVIHRIEYAEHVDPVCGRTLDKRFNDVVGIMPVPKNVLAAKEHLKPGIGHCFANEAKPFPGIFPQISNASVESSSSPNFGGPVADTIQFFANGQNIFDAHTRGQQRLVSVAQHKLGDAKGLFIYQGKPPKVMARRIPSLAESRLGAERAGVGISA
jgi:hypothetical protein